jgi:integrase
VGAGLRTRRKRIQQWITVRGTKREAEARQREVLTALDQDRYVPPSKLSLIDWMRRWLEKSVKPTQRPATYRSYRSIVENHLAKADCAFMRVQRVRPSDLEHYLASLTCARGTVRVHAAVLSRALKMACRDGVVEKSPAVALQWGRSKPDLAAGARQHCWSREEVKRFLEVSRQEDAQTAAFMELALDSGARKMELHGLLWSDVDWGRGELLIARQLDTADQEPTFGDTKTHAKGIRTIELQPATIELLRAHRQQQLELKMRNRLTYADHGLIFAKEDRDLQRPPDRLGQPIQTLANRRFRAIVTAAGVKKIRFHGCRHTVATLALQAGGSPLVVAKRLGHSMAMLQDIYAHATPEGQKEAAAAVGRGVFGR